MRCHIEICHIEIRDSVLLPQVTIQQLVPSKRVKRLRMCKEQGIHMLAEEERDEITEIS